MRRRRVRDRRTSGRTRVYAASSRRSRDGRRSIPGKPASGRCSSRRSTRSARERCAPSRASANVLPTTGWPAMGSSLPGVKMRMRMSVSARSGAVTKVVSAKPISRAICCMVSADRPGGLREHGELVSAEPPIREHVVVQIPVTGNGHARMIILLDRGGACDVRDGSQHRSRWFALRP